MSEKFTKMEREAMEAKRRGNQVEVNKQEVTDAPPVVTLREFTADTRETPEAAPGPLPPPPVSATTAAEPVVPESIAAPQGDSAVSEADIEALKNSAFGTPEAELPAEPDEDPVPVAEHKSMFSRTDCPRCGWNLDNDEVEMPTEEDKLEFMESILGDRRFCREVSLLGGRVCPTYRTVLVAEEDAITAHLNELMDRKTVQNEAEWSLAYCRARLVTMLKSVSIEGTRKKYKEISEHAGATPLEKLRVALEEVPKGWTLAVHGLLVQGMEATNAVYKALMSRAYDPNFWEGQVGESD